MMAIDPMLYEKLSGKKGDPRERAALYEAQNAVRPERNTNLFHAYMRGRFYKYAIGAGVSLLVLTAFFIAMAFNQ